MNLVKNLLAGIVVMFAGLMLAGCPTGNSNNNNNNNKKNNTKHPLEGNLLILQAYGTGDAIDGSVSHSFVELYNNTNAAVNLNGYSLQYAAGTKVADELPADGEWTVIDLSGKSIPAKSSFLILGKRVNASPRHQIADDYGDIIEPGMQLSNRAFKVALIHSTTKLSVQNPFNTDGKGKTVTGYVDMVGAENDATDKILGYEETPVFGFSKQKSVRRIFLTDTNDNNTDFESVDYRVNGITAEVLEVKQPKNSAYGAWNPATEPDTPNPPESSEKLMILQAYGAGPSTDGAVSHTFVELYNNTNEAINLSTYSIQYADGISASVDTVSDWTVINLTGTIPAYSSFLVRGTKMNNDGRLQIESADQNVAGFNMSNRSFKLALMSNQTKLAAVNPFDIDGTGAKAAGYVDLLGAINAAAEGDDIDASETAPARISKQRASRRGTLADTDNNAGDFSPVDYRTADMTVPRPRTSSEGAWDPVTGEAGEPQEPGEPQGPFVQAGNQDSLAGKLLILQAYGSSSTANGVSHSFVELYNTTATAIDLSGITLYYADGTESTTATEDGHWKKIALNGSIPSKTSYLVLGTRQSTGARHQITDNYGDINSSGFTLSNRAFKVALIRNTDTLTTQNPFNMGAGAKADGYIDMVGSANEYQTRDLIFGFETEPARNSASAAARRTSLTDTNNNKNDFAATDYRAWSSSNPDRMTDAELVIKRPKNRAHGAWDPFATPVTPEPTENKLFILQFGAATDGNISRSFVELYNTGDEAVNLSGYSLQYAAGFSTNSGNGAPGGNATTDGPWTKIDLTGTIQPLHSFLILGATQTTAAADSPPALAFENNYGDMNLPSFSLNNRAVKIALMSNTTLLTVQNPFDTGEGAKADGYVDMVGAINTAGTDNINGYETAKITNLNKQAGQRRQSLNDTDNNAADFARATFAGMVTKSGGGITAYTAEYGIMRPKNHAYGEWDPFAEPETPPPDPAANTLLILQIGAAGNTNNVSHSFVELYNAGTETVNLSTYSIQFSTGTSTSAGTDGAWTRINLTGSIPPRTSYLILGENRNTTGTAKLNFANNSGDVNNSFRISNDAAKVVLMSNQTTLATTVQNPFDTDGKGTKAPGYVDMVGGQNTYFIHGYETASGGTLTAQQTLRRKTIADTDNNATDFESVHYGNATDAVIALKRPRSLSAGAWNPVTGVKD